MRTRLRSTPTPCHPLTYLHTYTYTYTYMRPLPAPQDWTREEIQAVYDLPFVELLYRAATVIFFKKKRFCMGLFIASRTVGLVDPSNLF